MQQSFTPQELYDYIRSYRLARFSEAGEGMGWLHLNVKTHRFTLHPWQETAAVIQCRIQDEGCTDGGITLGGSRFVFDFENYGWAVEGILSSDQNKGPIRLALYR